MKRQSETIQCTARQDKLIQYEQLQVEARQGSSQPYKTTQAHMLQCKTTQDKAQHIIQVKVI